MEWPALTNSLLKDISFHMLTNQLLALIGIRMAKAFHTC